MESKNLRIRVRNSPWMLGIEMILFECGIGNKVVNKGKIVMEPHERGSVLLDENKIVLDDTTAQILMDDLWSCGVRPTEGKGSAGAMAATQGHLKDMRALVQKCMKVEL